MTAVKTICDSMTASSDNPLLSRGRRLTYSGTFIPSASFLNEFVPSGHHGRGLSRFALVIVITVMRIILSIESLQNGSKRFGLKTHT
jgi:hypothetical protein